MTAFANETIAKRIEGRGGESAVCERLDLAWSAFVHLGLVFMSATVLVFKTATAPESTIDAAMPGPEIETCADPVVSREDFAHWARRLLERRAVAI